MNLNLGGRVALVTGGVNGVGRKIALALAAEGAAIAVNYRSSEAEAQAAVCEIEALGQRAIACRADVGSYTQVQAMVSRIVGELGRLDIVVNNAGLAIRQRFVLTKPEDWKKQIDTCLYGAIHCCHAAAPHLQASKHGRIISLVGDSSRVGESGLSIVGAARAGTIGLMKSLAREFGQFGTTANTLSLGIVETAHDKAWVDANREKLVEFYPMRRLGQPDDIAPMAALLASDAGGWITGQVISISGGFSMV
jgi:NAD(P)-dependent dehydrogenase (short-subunit alcohol dehydrogenase family)